MHPVVLAGVCRMIHGCASRKVGMKYRDQHRNHLLKCLAWTEELVYIFKTFVLEIGAQGQSE
jgi:hypothetical protein